MGNFDGKDSADVRNARYDIIVAVKRIVDVLGAAAALIVTAPLMLVISLLLRRSQGRPVLFCQDRAGLHGKSFSIRKFRTMADARDHGGRMLPDDERITPIGRWLRTTSLDEIPEFWNVLIGDMSLVGPRPLPLEYLPRYTELEKRRHDCRPGVTGWAQVSGRNAVGWDERLAMDVWYVDNHSLRLDLRIIFRTILVVVKREGIGSQDTETMAPLRPNHDNNELSID
jgi:lipopolysaccharide/colanic/teichoic acid biosynthesis glycosyltransferase